MIYLAVFDNFSAVQDRAAFRVCLRVNSVTFSPPNLRSWSASKALHTLDRRQWAAKKKKWPLIQPIRIVLLISNDIPLWRPPFSRQNCVQSMEVKRISPRRLRVGTLNPACYRCNCVWCCPNHGSGCTTFIPLRCIWVLCCILISIIPYLYFKVKNNINLIFKREESLESLSISLYTHIVIYIMLCISCLNFLLHRKVELRLFIRWPSVSEEPIS